MGDRTYDIEELAAAAGMTARNVRAYRTRGLLPQPLRMGRTARYDDRHLERLRQVQRLRDAGLPLRMITEAAARGADLGPDGSLAALAREHAAAARGAIDVRDGPPELPAGAPPGGAGEGTTNGHAPGDAAGASPDRLLDLDSGSGRAWAPLGDELAEHLGADTALQSKLSAHGVVTGQGGLLYCSSDVTALLTALTRAGVGAATALSVALVAAETVSPLAAAIGALVASGRPLPAETRDLLARLSAAVSRDALGKELEGSA